MPGPAKVRLAVGKRHSPIPAGLVYARAYFL
jgi:hypothetical protein